MPVPESATDVSSSPTSTSPPLTLSFSLSAQQERLCAIFTRPRTLRGTSCSCSIARGHRPRSVVSPGRELKERYVKLSFSPSRLFSLLSCFPSCVPHSPNSETPRSANTREISSRNFRRRLPRDRYHRGPSIKLELGSRLAFSSVIRQLFRRASRRVVRFYKLVNVLGTTVPRFAKYADRSIRFNFNESCFSREVILRGRTIDRDQSGQIEQICWRLHGLWLI